MHQVYDFFKDELDTSNVANANNLDFFKDLQLEADGSGLSDSIDYSLVHDYFIKNRMKSVIRKEFVYALVMVSVKYLKKICGITINHLDVKGFYDPSELGCSHQILMAAHSSFNTEVLGFYSKNRNKIYVKIGAHLDQLLPTLFHELVHCYIHQNGIKFKDTWSTFTFGIPDKLNTALFTFKTHMGNANQEEGFCEMIVTLLYLKIFNKEIICSLVDSYWVGWRLCIESFLYFAKIFRDSHGYTGLDLIKITIKSMIHLINKNHNLYKFVDMVPINAYNKRATIRV